MYKLKEQEVTEELVVSLAGKLVHCTENFLTSETMLANERKKVNVWFAGTVAGVDKTVVCYDYATDVFYEEPKVIYRVLLTDGASYIVANDALIAPIEEEAFALLVKEYERKETIRKAILMPPK